MTRLTSAYTNASSEKSPSMICFNEAITIVKKSKNDDTRVNKPTAINIKFSYFKKGLLIY